MKLLAAALLLSAAFATAQTQPVLLRHALEPGSAFAWGLEVEATVHQEMGTEQMDSRMRIALHFAATVTAGKGGFAEVAHRVCRVEANTDSRLAKIDYDSDKPGTDPGQLKQLAGLVDQVFVVTLDALGHISHVQPPKAFDQLTKDQLGVGDFDTLFCPYFLPLPVDQVATGATWESTLKMLDVQYGGGEVKVTDRLATVADGRAVIERTLALGAVPQRPGIKFELQKAEGSATFDVASGRVQESKLELQATVSREAGVGRTVRGTSRVLLQARREALPAPKPAPAPK